MVHATTSKLRLGRYSEDVTSAKVARSTKGEHRMERNDVGGGGGVVEGVEVVWWRGVGRE